MRASLDNRIAPPFGRMAWDGPASDISARMTDVPKPHVNELCVNEPIVARWFDLTRRRLPDAAAARHWPVRFDHCFQRILLDNAVGGPWREHIAAPAWRNAGDELLGRALALGEACLTGDADLPQLNRNSLRWRGKLGPQAAS